ncbi:MAG: flagellar protein FlaG [Deltaproteobacteria bacterium]|nr:flagellar protein FlaG [Deltaproteobacteria bacterium]
MEIQPVFMDTGLAESVMSYSAPVQSTKASEAEAPPQKASSGGSLSSEQVEEMVRVIGEQLQAMNVSLNFTPYGQNDEKMAIVVSEKETGKVIREIPPKELQNLYMKMNELIGIIFNRRA